MGLFDVQHDLLESSAKGPAQEIPAHLTGRIIPSLYIRLINEGTMIINCIMIFDLRYGMVHKLLARGIIKKFSEIFTWLPPAGPLT